MTINNRSEIVFAYDAVNCNPNGNPIDPAGAPRIDEETGVGYITDVRLKRYIRDEFENRGETIYIAQARTREGDVMTRDQLLKRLFGLDPEADSEEVLKGEFLDDLLSAIDVRLFGALLSINDETRKQTDLPAAITGPVQFAHGRSIHPVEPNYETNSLVSVIGTKEGKGQGGYDLDDARIKYGMFAFGGRVNPGAAETTNLTNEDVRRLDRVTWNSIKNQTLSRSKVGQEPRLYLRVEYDGPEFDIGGLDRDLSTVESERDAASFRSIRDLTIDVSDLLDRLRIYSDRIETIHVATDDLIRFSLNGSESRADGNTVDGREFVTAVEEIAPVETIDVPTNVAAFNQQG